MAGICTTIGKGAGVADGFDFAMGDGAGVAVVLDLTGDVGGGGDGVGKSGNACRSGVAVTAGGVGTDPLGGLLARAFCN